MFNIADKHYKTCDINKTVMNCLVQNISCLGSSRRELRRTCEFFPRSAARKTKNLGTRIIYRVFSNRA